MSDIKKYDADENRNDLKLADAEKFDQDNKFVDKRIKSFYDIYKKRCEYKIYSAEEIDNNQITIN